MALRSIHSLPGPRGWPVVGSLFQLRPATVHQGVERWARRYGPVFRFRVGPRQLLVLADHAEIAAVLRDRPEGWRRSSQLQAIGHEMGLTPGLFGSEGDAWRAQRRMVMAGLDPAKVRAYEPTLQRVLQRLQRRWLGAARAGRALALQPELMRYTVDTVAGLAFGQDINTLEDDGVVIQQHLDRLFPALFRRTLALLPYWRWVKLPQDRALERSVAEIQRTINHFVAEARARLAADPARRAQPPNLLEAMIVAAESDASAITDTQVAANVLTMLLAGEDTTANTLAWALHLLWRHPPALARLQAELRALPPGAGLDTLAGLPWLDACLNETMRLKPVAPFTVLEALRDTQVAGVAVPAGTYLWCVLRHDSLNEQHFEQAGAFRPERWLAAGAGAPSTGAKRVAMPFGAGPRVCPGRYLALAEMRQLLAMLFNHFDLTGVQAPGGGEAAERMNFTMVPVGLTMTLRERAGAGS